MLLCFISAAILISLHFVLLEKWTAAGLTFLGVIRFATSYHTTSIKVRNFFLGASVVISIVTFQGFLSVLSCFATIFSTMASFHKEDQRLRQFMILSTSLWIIHNFIAWTPVAIVMEVLFVSSNLVGYYRFYIKKKKET